MPTIDSHTHVFAAAQAEARGELCARDAAFAEMYAHPKAAIATPAELLAAMDAAGVERAVAAGFAFTAAADIGEQNACLLAAMREAPRRIIPLATINLADDSWRRVAEEALAAGARGFGELRPHNQRWDPLGAAGHGLCDLAGAAGAVLLWHVSEPVGHTYPGKHGGISPAELCQLASVHPATRMIAAHLGGGLPFYLQMPEIRAALANVWFDTAAASLLYDEHSVARAVDLAGTGRVLFGSDYPLLSPSRQLQRLRALLPDGIAQAVCGDNAATLFAD
ncbi:MAG: amidohydrolase [Chloroflexi bacterium]|nr:amidohydrolase [Chloroflexota bacterium]